MIEAEVPPAPRALHRGEDAFAIIHQSSLAHYLTRMAHSILMLLGVRKEQIPSAETTLGTLLLACVLSYVFHARRRKHVLARELEAARAELAYLQEKLRQEVPNRQETKKEIRIFMDGAFDLMHFGHANAFRLARSLGTYLVVGVNSDESITKCKGVPPLLNDKERLTMVESCKFVDEVLPNCPYVMNKDYLDFVIERYKIDFVVHGSDPCIVDGQDVYATAKEAGKYRSIPRTEGVSTTDIIGRMLLMTKEHHCHTSQEDASQNGNKKLGSREFALPTLANTQSKFLTTSRMLKLFSAGVKAPTKDMRIVYVDGAWDLFHPGHCRFLEAARKRGDYLIVGVHGDALINRMRGMNLPLMNLNERVLSVLSCKYVSDVLIDSPFTVTPEMISALNIAEVVHGSCSDEMGLREHEEDRYGHAIRAGIYTKIRSPSSFDIRNIIHRIQKHQETFQRRYEHKKETEDQFYLSQRQFPL